MEESNAAEINPYAASTSSSDGSEYLLPITARRLWYGYMIAPSIPPVLATVVCVVLAFAWNDPNDIGTPMGIIFLPVMILSVGNVLSYASALILGMPIIFFLFRRQKLNGWTVHLTTIIACALFGAIITVFSLVADGSTDLEEAMYSLIGFPLFLAPFALPAGTVYWWLTCRNRRYENPIES